MNAYENTYQRKFEKAFLAGERSDVAIHKALIDCLVDFHKSDKNTVGIFWLVKFMIERSPESHRTNAILKWFDLNGFSINTGEKLTVKTKRKQVFDTVWLNGCKDKPWYKVARDMQEVKAWVDPMESVKRQYAEGYIMGDVTRVQLEELFAAKMVADIIGFALGNDKLQQKAAKRMEKLLAA